MVIDEYKWGRISSLTNELRHGLFGVAPNVLVEQPDHSGTRASGYEEEAGEFDPRGQGISASLLGDWICYDAWPGPVEESFVTAFFRNSSGKKYSADKVTWTTPYTSGLVTWTAPVDTTIYSFGLEDEKTAVTMEQKIASKYLRAGDVYNLSFNISSTIA
jgi:hypothetical protein